GRRAMGYYTRVLTKRADCPTYDELRAAVRKKRTDVTLERDEDSDAEWTNLVLAHGDGTEIAALERNVVTPAEQAAEELEEFIEAIADCKPSSAAAWLASYLPQIRVIYAFQHLSGTEKRDGFEALHLLSNAIWARGDAILQADHEGFSNEDGFHILWQFYD